MKRPPDFEIALWEEVYADQAMALKKASEKMLAAIAAIEEHDASGDDDSQKRAELVEDAGVRAYYFVIQRESMGLSNAKAALDFYKVPGEVRAKMRLTPEALRRQAR